MPKMKTFFTTSINDVEIKLVQCFRPGKGYELLAHKFNGFICWCLVCKDEAVVLVKHLDFSEMIEAMVACVRADVRVDDVVA